ncbi:NADH dehydrogenase [ubiquinone] 1 alpha subcomplex subunit 8 [Phlebotomus argentipes]|uniref:NADH dehydrogenase [ubiquinone] 1 alpha subcomplex subunit 8 n=1 Tax=Phlebotomus argentipes TaxID=94469 RepID=UPI00289375C4|nr:NADH dehydrogenase [ubiquinone] 1 alpha subcomplex subunit 8 [Phlebotomus argentipes]
MVVTYNVELPTEEELTVPEVNLSGPALKAGAFHLGKYCEFQNNEFMLCRDELKDPRKCLKEGNAVTSCALEFFRKVKKTCREEFTQYTNCLDKSSQDQAFKPCRKTQGVYDKCILDNLQIERPHYGYFCRARIHDSERPAPPKKEKKVYPDATPGLPDDYPRESARYGSRNLILE